MRLLTEEDEKEMKWVTRAAYLYRKKKAEGIIGIVEQGMDFFFCWIEDSGPSTIIV